MPTPSDSTERQRLEDEMASLGYQNLRWIDDKLCGTHDYAYTRAIVVGLTMGGVEYRYCYPTRVAADVDFMFYTSLEEHPPGQWIKCKGTRKGEYMDFLNPNWSDS